MNLARRNDKLIDGQRTEFVSLYSPNTSWGNIISLNLGMPMLRAYWPFTSVDESGNVYDMSGQGRTLTDNGTPTFSTYGLIAYANLIAVSSQYYSYADDAGVDFTDVGLTICGWFNFDAPSTGALTGLVSKYLSLGNQRSYRLWKSATNIIGFTVNGVGTAVNDVVVSAVAADYVVDRWLFIAGRFTPQTKIDLFVSGNWYTNAAGVPASLYNSTGSLMVGRTDGGNYIDGQLCHIVMCATAASNIFIEALYQHSRAMFGV